jgi:hypothetical protein
MQAEDDGRVLRIPPHMDEGNTRQPGRGNRMEHSIKGRRPSVSLQSGRPVVALIVPFLFGVQINLGVWQSCDYRFFLRKPPLVA